MTSPSEKPITFNPIKGVKFRAVKDGKLYTVLERSNKNLEIYSHDTNTRHTYPLPDVEQKIAAGELDYVGLNLKLAHKWGQNKNR